MKREEFFTKFVDKCGLQDKTGINEETLLASLENWDSLALISAIATFKAAFDFSPNLDALQSCKTLKDVLNLANNYYEK